MSEPSWDENPFASPSVVEPSDAGYEHLTGPKHASVPASVTCLLLLVSTQFGLWTYLWANFILSRPNRTGNVTILVLLVLPAIVALTTANGVLRRHRLAFHFLKVAFTVTTPLIAAFAASWIWVSGLRGDDLNIGLIGAAVFALTSVGIWYLLGRRALKVFFGLKCPRCGKLRDRTATFFFTRARCRKCRVTW